MEEEVGWVHGPEGARLAICLPGRGPDGYLEGEPAGISGLILGIKHILSILGLIPHIQHLLIQRPRIQHPHQNRSYPFWRTTKSTRNRAENARGKDKQPERATRRAIALFFQNSYSESCKSLIILKCSAYSLGSENCFFLA